MRKHPRWGRRRIAKFYFLKRSTTEDKLNPVDDYISGGSPLK